MLREMQLSRKESKREIQDVVEHSYRRRSLSGRKSHSDHKHDKETDHTSNPDKESNLPERGPSTSDKHARGADKNPTISANDVKASDVKHAKANAGYGTPTENEFAISNVKGDELVGRDLGTDKVTDDSQNTADGKESLRGTP